jgi:hypothetical protein
MLRFLQSEEKLTHQSVVNGSHDRRAGTHQSGARRSPFRDHDVAFVEMEVAIRAEMEVLFPSKYLFVSIYQHDEIYCPHPCLHLRWKNR